MKKIFWFIGLVVISIITYTFFSEDDMPETSPTSSYKESILAIRKTKDKALKESKESPIEDKAHFKGLPYFDVDSSYQVVATLDLLTTGQSINVQMTGGETEKYEAYANATFELKGQKCALKIFKTPEGMLFIPFKDLTSGKETYGGGRYLDADPSSVKEHQITLDFNTAYHPYCAYNEGFTCPIPPAENLIPVAIMAGEKLDKAH